MFGQHRLRRGVGIERVGLAAQSTRGSVTACHLDNAQAGTGQAAGQFGPVTSGAFDANGADVALGVEELDDLPVASSGRGELAVGNTSSHLVDHRDVMGVRVRIDTGDNKTWFCNDGSGPSWQQWGTLTGRADKTLMGLFGQAPMKSCPPGQRT